MTARLTDEQLKDAFVRAEQTEFSSAGDTTRSMAQVIRDAKAKGLRAVADLAITHLEAELHELREELDDTRARLELAETEESFLE